MKAVAAAMDSVLTGLVLAGLIAFSVYSCQKRYSETEKARIEKGLVICRIIPGTLVEDWRLPEDCP